MDESAEQTGYQPRARHPLNKSATHEVRYTLTVDDLHALLRRVPVIRVVKSDSSEGNTKQKSPSSSWTWFIYFVIGMILFGMLMTSGKDSPPFIDQLYRFIWQFVGAFLGIIAAVLFIFWMMVVNARSRGAAELSYRGPSGKYHRAEWRVSISPDGVAQSNAFCDIYIRWEGIEEVVQTEEHLFLYEMPDSAIIIPRRVFPDSSSFEEFARLSHEYFNATTRFSETSKPTPSESITP